MSIIVSLLTEWNGKALTKGQKQLSLFEKQAKRLGVALGSALSVRKIAQLAKSSVKAFVEEDKAVRALSTNLSNLGLAYDIAPIERYIRELQYATGVADKDLRPAFQQLVQATRSVTDSQDLLALALDISAGTGKSLAQVTQGLTRAYLGNNTSLGRLNLGLTKSELKTKKFDQIVEDLSVRFNGQAKKAAGTYAGQLAILSAAADDAQEVLGQKLVQSLELLAGQDMGVKGLATTMNDMATDIGNMVLGIADFIKQVKTLGGLKSDMSAPISVFIGGIPGLLAMKQGQKLSAQMNKENQTAIGHQKDLAALSMKVLKNTKATVQELTKKQKLELASKALLKSSDLMDMDKIQLAAASQNAKLTESEKLRLEYMQKRLELEDAIAAKEANRALALANQLGTLEQKINSFEPVSPFGAWEDAIARMQNGLYNLGISEKRSGLSSLSVAPQMVSDSTLLGGVGAITPDLATRNPSGVQININVSGTGDLSDETKQKVVDAVVEASSGGIATNWFRTTGRATMAI